jgi:hypothetical protein
MPEFQLDTSRPATVDFSDLSDFAQGYVEALFFCAQGDDDGMDVATFADLSLGALCRIVADCDAFGEQWGDLDEIAPDYDRRQAGRDFWFSRCGHGVGFWDRGLGEVGDRLHDLAQSFGNLDPYMDDDGKVYLA